MSQQSVNLVKNENMTTETKTLTETTNTYNNKNVLHKNIFGNKFVKYHNDINKNIRINNIKLAKYSESNKVLYGSLLSAVALP